MCVILQELRFKHRVEAMTIFNVAEYMENPDLKLRDLGMANKNWVIAVLAVILSTQLLEPLTPTLYSQHVHQSETEIVIEHGGTRGCHEDGSGGYHCH